MNKIKFSILIAAYNDEKYIEDTINSVLNSSYQNFEIIIVNDCSKDDTYKLIKRVSKDNQNIKCFTNKKNMGLSYVRNYLISKATGEYFIFVDGDDQIDKDLLKNIYECIILNPKANLIHYNISTNNNGKIIKGAGCDFFGINGQNAFHELFVKHYNIAESACCYAINLNYYKKLGYDFLLNSVHEDFGLIPLLVINADNVSSINFDGYYYYRRQNSITTNKTKSHFIKRTNDMILHYKSHLKEIEKINFINKITKKEFLNFITNSMIQSLSYLDVNNRNKLLSKELKKQIIKNYNPLTLKQFIRKIVLLININIYILLFYRK